MSTDDDGYGWLVVMATFFVGFITDGILFAFGILLIELLQAFNEGRASTVIVASVVTGVMHLIGPIAGLLSEKYGCRVVVIAGSLISSLGFLLSSFVNKLVYLYITYGLLGGLGFGLMYLPASVCVLQHFHHSKKRSLANGLSMCGSGAGACAFNLLSGFLLEAYGWRGTLLIEAGILLNGIVFGLILVSPQPNTDQTARRPADTFEESDVRNGRNMCLIVKAECVNITSINTEEVGTNVEVGQDESNAHDRNTTLDDDNDGTEYRDIIQKDNIDVEEECMPKVKMDVQKQLYPPITHKHGIDTGNDVRYSLMDSTGNRNLSSRDTSRDTYEAAKLLDGELDCMLDRQSDDTKEADKVQTNSVPKDRSLCHTLFDVSLLKNTKLLAFLCNGFLVNLAFTIPVNFIPDQAVENGMSKHEAFWLASSIGITNTISRIIIGWTADRKFVNRFVLLEVLLFSVGVATILSVLLESFSGKMVYACVYGFLIGGYVTMCPVLLADLFGVDVIARSFGLLMFSVGISGLVSSPIAGWLYDHTGSYVTSFIAAGSEFILAAFVLAIPFIYERFNKLKSK